MNIYHCGKHLPLNLQKKHATCWHDPSNQWPPSNRNLWGRVEATKYGNCTSSKTGFMGSCEAEREMHGNAGVSDDEVMNLYIASCKFQEVHCLTRNGLSLCFHKVNLFFWRLSCQIMQISESNITTGLGCSQDCANGVEAKRWPHFLHTQALPGNEALYINIPTFFTSTE